MKELGWRPLLHCSIRGPDLTNYWDSLGQDASYIISLASWDSSFADAVSKRLVKDYFVQDPNAKYCGSVVGNSYNCVVVLADAIKRAGTLDRNKIRDAIATTDLVSLCGRMTFASDGQANMSENVRQWQNGKNLVVFPKEHANATIMLAPPWGQ
jgi:branched-chain amino acid transport system substrate-binding protein